MADIFGGKVYPRGMAPEKYTSKDTLWLQIIPRKLVMDNLNKRTDNVSANTTKLEPIWLLMPSEHMMSLQHQWEDLATPAAALKGIASKVQQQIGVARGTVGGSVSKGYKSDNPLLFTGSDRRSFSLPFTFSVYSSAYDDVYAPVQSLMEYSCANIGDDVTEFTFPYVFSLQTYNGKREAIDIISMKTAGLQSVQPTYKAPYIGGYPSSCDLTLSFVDLNPMYRDTLYSEKSKRITVKVR